MIALDVGQTRLRVVFGDRRDGTDAAALMQRAHGERPRHVTSVRQVHGTTVVRAPADELLEGDGVWLPAGEPIAAVIRTADCMPVVLAGEDGAAVVAHVGWPGLVRGMVPSAVASLGSAVAAALVGPHVHSCCYEFVGPARAEVVDALGTDVFDGDALSLARGLAQVLEGCGVSAPIVIGGCTGCGGDWWSWRARREQGRQVTVVMPWAS